MNFFLFHSKNWIFSVRLTELNLFSLNMTKELDSYFLNMTQWIEQLNFFNMTQRIGPFVRIWRKELDTSFKYDSKKWTFVKIWLTKLNFFEFDPQNWTFFLNMTHRIEPFFSIWLKELNPYQNMTRRIKFLIWLKELTFGKWVK